MEVFGKKWYIKLIIIAAIIAPEKEIIWTGDRKLPSITAARQVLKNAIKMPEWMFKRMIAYKVITFAKPNFNHGKILGSWDSIICRPAAQAVKIATRVICLILLLLFICGYLVTASTESLEVLFAFVTITLFGTQTIES